LSRPLTPCSTRAWAGGSTSRPTGATASSTSASRATCRVGAWEHREGVIKGFTKRYGLKLLVYYEHYPDIRDAIQREKNMKHWPRAWKARLINGFNPEWADLYEQLA
jgi:putative endonuclease